MRRYTNLTTIFILLAMFFTLSCSRDVAELDYTDTEENSEDETSDTSTTGYIFVEEAAYSNSLVINEIASKKDFIELYNRSGETIDLSGYKLSDDKGLSRSDLYIFPDGASIEAWGYYLLEQEDEAGDSEFTFGLGSDDQVTLYDHNDNIVDQISFPDNNIYNSHVDGRSYGRMNDGVSWLVIFLTSTPGSENIAYNEIDADDDTYVDPEEEEESEMVNELYPDWTTATHSDSVDPNFDVVFAQGEVLRLDITISSTDYSSMRSDLSSNLKNIMSDNSSYSPITVPCTISFGGRDWYEVGIRYKGNSSLQSAYSSGVYKLSFKLDFDEFEDEYPDLKNQRFYGFKQLNLNNNYNDSSFMRDKVASDLFLEFGIEAANTSFCEVYIDTGSGSKYFGLYTIMEEIDDSVIRTQVAEGGNLYKPEEDASTFKSGTYDESEFYLKTNEETCDYSDVLALYNILHADYRTSHEDIWKSTIETIFDVDRFMKWLAVTATIQNWDTYGKMGHNYFLYNNPETSLLTWIPWDHNEAFKSGSGNNSALGPNYSSVSSSWPLISYLIAVDEYEQIYEAYLREFIDNVFIVSNIQATYEEYYELIKSSVYAEEKSYTFLSSSSSFDSAVTTLKTHAQSRYTTINNYLK